MVIAFLAILLVTVVGACAGPANTRSLSPAGPTNTVGPAGSTAQAALVRRIVGDMGYWSKRGIRITQVGPAPDGTTVIVGTPNPATAQNALYQHYGRDAIKVVASNPDGGLAPAYTLSPTR